MCGEKERSITWRGTHDGSNGWRMKKDSWNSARIDQIHAWFRPLRQFSFPSLFFSSRLIQNCRQTWEDWKSAMNKIFIQSCVEISRDTIELASFANFQGDCATWRRLTGNRSPASWDGFQTSCSSFFLLSTCNHDKGAEKKSPCKGFFLSRCRREFVFRTAMFPFTPWWIDTICMSATLCTVRKCSLAETDKKGYVKTNEERIATRK